MVVVPFLITIEDVGTSIVAQVGLLLIALIWGVKAGPHKTDVGRSAQ